MTFDIEDLYIQGCAAGDHLTGLQAVFQAGLDASANATVQAQVGTTAATTAIDATDVATYSTPALA